jgi:hypothetical protein
LTHSGFPRDFRDRTTPGRDDRDVRRMEPTPANQTARRPSLNRSEQVSAVVWTGLITAALLTALERFAGTLSERSVVTALTAACIAGLLGLLAAGLALRGAVDPKDAAPAGFRWHPERVPAIVMSVLPPLAIGWLLLPAGAVAAQCFLALMACVSAALLMGNAWMRVLHRRLSGEDLAELVQEALPARSERTPRIVAVPHVIGFPSPGVSSPVIAAVAEPEPPVPFALFHPESESETEAEAAPEGDEDRGVVFAMTRRAGEEGEDSLQGTLRLDLPAGRRQATFHIPFIPPFASAPRFECEADGDDSLRVKVGLVLPWGARIEARRSHAEDEATVDVAFQATLPAPNAA